MAQLLLKRFLYVGSGEGHMGKKWGIFVVLLLFVPFVAAAEIDLSEAIGIAGEQLARILQNEYAVFLITLIVGTIMLQGFVRTGLERVPQFEAGGHTKSISWALSILIVLSFVWGSRSSGVQGLLDNLGIFKPILLVLIAVLVFKGIKKTLHSS